MQPVRRWIAMSLVCVLLLFSSKPAKADTLQTDAVLIVVGIALIASAITVGVVLAIKHKPTLHGCAASGPDGLELRNTGDSLTYQLIGDVAGLKAGDRVRVNGKKKKVDGGAMQFIVEKSKDYGACQATP